VELGRRVRTETKTRTRQPLSGAVVHLAGPPGELTALLDTVAEELNVKEVRFAESGEAFGGWVAKPDFKALGPRLGRRVQAVARALAADPELAARLAEGAAVELRPDDGPPLSIGPGDVLLARQVRSGWGVASDGGVTLALDLEVSPELRLEGLARELVRLVQDARKEAGLQVTDRIVLGIETTGDAAGALEAHRDYVAEETLADSVQLDPVSDDRREATVDGSRVIVSLRPVV
jgi:isoleucyl-tRNA synthetase